MSSKLYEYLIPVFFLLNTLRNVCLMLTLSTIATVAFYFSYLVFAVIILLAYTENYRVFMANKRYSIASLLLIVLLILLPSLYGINGWTVNGYLAISFLLTVLFLTIAPWTTVSQKTIVFCYATVSLEAVTALVESFLSDSYSYGDLELHIGNPNQTSIMIWAMIVPLFLLVTKCRRFPKLKGLLWAAVLGLTVLMYLTKCRSGLLSVAVCVVGFVWVRYLSPQKEIPRWVHIGILSAPFVFPALILILRRFLPSDVTVFGKLLFSGREPIWENIVKEMLYHPLSTHLTTSPYYTTIMVDGIKTLKNWGSHNGVLAIQWNYGLAVMVLATFLFLKNIRDVRKESQGNFNAQMVYLAILASVVSLCFEEGLLLGNVCTTSLLPFLFVFGKSECLAKTDVSPEKEVSRNE